ncbi:conserved hypothetical protein [Leishmania major strain Friedlin]|uniref:Uncharacterized protein n=1 Tax=Leishmania major TaxID=5664 RepID=E9AES1_LEIMA|nr:conserved hypothetical protein [Leishmania major strain Friedlin]CAG9582447.1 hypothetical_protein_-_conserved [Leishmania major strain Friedlin]CBZ12724.1 conserved hypothetical protein [Leishmania major strain Friedlin]|eukprot:XP_003722491.1 conserved hypothetical protein [Leishmania major strain Friedlin]
MLASSLPLLRRRGTGHVVKYLEGVPTPTKLIDHLAGADLHASAELPFFTTVPRYVDVQREQRLSRLYFHHVLYPAGGARLPYQAVVVRGGRAVRASETHLLRVKKATSWTPLHAEQQQQQQPTAVVAPAARRPSPLAVPSSQLGSSGPASSSPAAAKVPVMSVSTTVPTEDVPAPASWARVDPARRPYFSAGTPRSHEHRRSSHRPPEDTERSARVVEDTTLAPLRGALEHFWNELRTTRNSSTQDVTGGPPSAALLATNEMAERVRQLLVSPAAGLLWMPTSASLSNAADICEESRHTSSGVSDSSERRFWTELMAHVQERVSAMTMHVGGGGDGEVKSPAAVRTCLYVQTRLPPSATVTLPLAQVRDYVHDGRETAGDLSVHDDASERVVCRLAGGLEPVVSFAVGRPLTPVTTDGAATSPSDRAFAHVTCLTRLNMRVTSAPLAKAPAVNAANVSSGTHPVKEAVPHFRDSTLPSAEPWRLGGVGLDLMTPLHARTVAERHTAKPSAHTNGRLTALTENGTSNVKANADSAEAGRYVIGRTDAETYVLPQRELLLTLHVPTHTEDMCAAQNQERLRRQVRLGRASRAAMSAAWPTEQARLTSARRAEGQYANAMSANETGAHRTNAPLQVATTPLAASPSMPLLLSRLSYEVRALPGDVVYIPRGWGFDVQRIVGTATIDNGSRGRKGGRDADKVGFYDHRAVAAHKGTWPGHRPETPSKSSEPNKTESHVASTASVQLTSVEVDALCLNYQPYPELTEKQAAVYVAANYVHSGVDEFYERGGNSVYRSYQ